MGFKLPLNLFNGDKETEEIAREQPVSPDSQLVSTSLLSLSVHAVFEFDEPFAEISEFAAKAIADSLISKNPLFSCIMKKDDAGVLRWQKTSLNTDDHIFFVELPPGEESYDPWLDKYISKLSLTPLNPSRPLWEVHVLNFKTSKAGATMVFKVHHSLGDGISLMSILFSSVRRVDNPDLPPTFPTTKPSIRSSTTSVISIAAHFFHRLWYIMLVGWYTLLDVISASLTMAGWIEDSQLPIRGPPGVENMPTALSSATFQLEDIKQIKFSAGGTVNDVITGIVFYGLQRYLQICFSVGEHTSKDDAYEKRSELPTDEVIKQLKNSRVTALCWINMRALRGIQSIDEMLKPKAQAPWGNHVGFLPLRVPIMGKVENPLQFVRLAKRIMDRHKMSLAVFIYNAIQRAIVVRLKRPQESSKYIYDNIANTTMSISNMIGPMEKIAIDGNPIKSFSFFVSGLPQALGLCVVSYAGAVVLQINARKAYVDADMLSKCFMEAFEEIKKAHSKSTNSFRSPGKLHHY